jgi:hypothetical protein
MSQIHTPLWHQPIKQTTVQVQQQAWQHAVKQYRAIGDNNIVLISAGKAHIERSPFFDCI